MNVYRRSNTTDENRHKKTSILLNSIAFVFCFSWLPLHLFNIIVDFIAPDEDNASQWMNLYIMYAFCHMLGMSSSCTNPILYGWLNENFRKEFSEIFSFVLGCKLNRIDECPIMTHEVELSQMNNNCAQPILPPDIDEAVLTKDRNEEVTHMDMVETIRGSTIVDIQLCMSKETLL